MILNSQSKYGAVAKFFHWLTAIIIVVMYGTIYYDQIPFLPKTDINTMIFHKSSGLLLLTLAVIRFLWRLYNQVPYEDQMNDKKDLLAKVNFYMLYFFIFAMPLSGIFMSIFAGKGLSFYGLFSLSSLEYRNLNGAKLFHDIHVQLVYFFLFFLCLHICGAFYNALVNKRRIVSGIINMDVR